MSLVGTPLTHARYLRRHHGSYGPGVRAGTETFPGPATPVEGLMATGDCVFPGIGLPAVAGSGFLTANTLASPVKHWKMLDEIFASL